MTEAIPSDLKSRVISDADEPLLRKFAEWKDHLGGNKSIPPAIWCDLHRFTVACMKWGLF